MARFKLQPGETILLKGPLLHSQGEAGVKNFLTGKYKVQKCGGILTTTRFVACQRNDYFPWGLLIWVLIYFIWNRKILFAVPLQDVAAVEVDPNPKVKQFIIRTRDGGEFKLLSDAFFNKTPQWTQAIKDAVASASPQA